MKMKNASGHKLRVPCNMLSKEHAASQCATHPYTWVEAGEEMDFQDGYCHPRRAVNGARIPSACEKLAPGLMPADESCHEEWAKAPSKEWQPPAHALTMAQMQARGLSPGKAALAAEAAAKKAAAAPKPAPKPAPKKAKEEEPKSKPKAKKPKED